MKALVIGGIGYVGGRLCAYLESQGHHVAITTRRPHDQVPAWVHANEIIPVHDFQKVQQIFKGRDIVFHLAAPDEIAAEKNPLEALNAGAEGTWSILQSMIDSGQAGCPFIYLSTFHVYGKSARGIVDQSTVPYPVHPYGLGRYLGECVVRSFHERHKVKALCVRMSNSFGVAAGFDVPRWSLIFNDLCLQAVKNKEMILKTPGLQKRNFITLHDATRALEYLAQRPEQWPHDGLIHLGSQNQLSVLKVAEMVAQGYQQLWGSVPRIVRPDPKPGDHPSEFVYESKRLAALGFAWENPIAEEIKATLKLCRKSLAVASPSI